MTMQVIKVSIADEIVSLYIEKKRIRNMYLRVNEDGSLHCTAPYGTEQEDIIHFVKSKENWYFKVRGTVSKSQRINEEGVTSPIIYIFGEKKYVRYLYSKKGYLEIEGDIVTFYIPDNSEEVITKTFRAYAKKELLKLIEEKRKEWDYYICEMNLLPLPSIKVRYMKSKWGVCYPSRHEITLSLRLIHYPIESFEYVLLHEYVHFLVPNHSTKFYNIVKKYMPDYKKYDSYLK